ncbi:MAG: hypothetical protein MI920_00865 [Kiloniellales bacterium]|nr:hypothetical protein [Kiloniellales bacterium]
MAHQPSAAKQESVLLLGNYRPSLAVARALSEAGYRVIVTPEEFPPLRRSRFVKEIWRANVSSVDDPAYVEALQVFLKSRPDIALIVPVSQKLMTVLLPHRERLHAPLLISAPEAVRTCIDKTRLSQIAAEAGVPVEPFVLVSGAEALIEKADALGYPCVAKSNEGREGAIKVMVFTHPEEVRHVAALWPDSLDDLILQRFAPGLRYNRYYLAHKGRILRLLDVKILRTDRINGSGLGTEGVSIAPLTALDAPSNSLIEALDYTGIGCLQYLVDEPSGAISFLEINPRFGGHYNFAHDCGFDMTQAFLDVMQDRRLEQWSAPFDYPRGRRYAWLHGDLEGLVTSLENRLVTGRQALPWLFQAFAAGLRSDMDIFWRWDDPLPALALWSRELGPLTWRAGRQAARITLGRLLRRR